MTGPAYCCYHDDQETFKSALGDFRKSFPVPQRVSKACAMSVCTCRKGDKLQRTSLGELRLLESQGLIPSDSDFLHTLDNTSAGVSPSSKQFIKDALYRKESDMESALRLIVIFKLALHNDYLLLNEELNNRKSRMTSNDDKKKINTHVVVRCIRARRKRRAESKFSTTVSLPNGQRVFIYSPIINKVLIDVSKKFKPCVVEIAKQRLSTTLGLRLADVPITAWCENKRLIPLINEIRETFKVLDLDDRRPTRLCGRSRRSNNADRNASDTVDTHTFNDIILYAKETKSDDYDKKAHNNNSHSPVTPTPGIKNTVKCYNCQLPQATLPPSKDGRTDTCKYHPGFVANGKWSCCQQDSDKYVLLSSQHISDGCVRSERHKWLYQNMSCVKSMSCKHSELHKIKRDTHCS